MRKPSPCGKVLYEVRIGANSSIPIDATVAIEKLQVWQRYTISNVNLRKLETTRKFYASKLTLAVMIDLESECKKCSKDWIGSCNGSTR